MKGWHLKSSARKVTILALFRSLYRGMTSISVVRSSITCFQCLVIWTLSWFGWGCAVYLFRVLMFLGCILGGRLSTSYQILSIMLLKLHTKNIAHTLIHLVKMKCTWRRRWKMKLAVYFFKSSNGYPAWTQNGLRSVLSASCDKALEFFYTCPEGHTWN